MNRLIINRLDYQEKQVLGIGFVFDGINLLWSFKSLELPWKGNLKQVSCIPKGKYPLRKISSPSHGYCFEVIGVANRTNIQIHSANFFSDLLGCIAPGMDYADINKDGVFDVTSSKMAMDKLLDLLPESTTIEIYGLYE